jgi:CDP-diacylglycerol--glycerol-3-phosphate 3-phosphatidyltransferase
MATMTPPRSPPGGRERIFTLPNQLTGARLVLAFVLFALITAELYAWGLFVFALAALTDWLDGYVARLQGQTSALGRVLDPLVDKVLICGAFVFLMPHGLASEAGWVTPWMVTVVLARELLVTGLRGYLESLGVRFGADWLGKLKMVLQCAALVAILVVLCLPPEIKAGQTGTALTRTRDVLVWAMLAATLLSGLQYVWKGFLVLRESEKPSA